MRPDEKENPGVGVRVGATPEPTDDECERLWTLHCALGDEHVHPHSIHRYTDAVRRALGTVVYQCPRCSTSMAVDPSAKPAALRAPEPLTAEPNDLRDAIIDKIARGWLGRPLTDMERSYARAALEGGVSRTEPALTDRQIAGIAGCIVAPNDRLWNLYFARAILVATKGQS